MPGNIRHTGQTGTEYPVTGRVARAENGYAMNDAENTTGPDISVASGDLQRLSRLGLRRRLELLGDVTGAVCDRSSEDDCADYLDGLMEPGRVAAFESHLPGCPKCLATMVRVIEADEAARRDSVRLRAGQVRQPAGPPVSDSEPLLLAATPGRQVFERYASGIAVDPRAGSGRVLDCVAQVIGQEGAGGSLTIFGSQVQEREIDGRRFKTTAPLETVRDVLSVLFRTDPRLRACGCADQAVSVQIVQPGEGFLSEGMSLSLAVAAAVYCAVARRKLPATVAFSGSLEITGRIKRVSDLELKLQVARDNGKTVLVLPGENRAQVEQLPELERSYFTFRFFETLDEVLTCIDSISVPDDQNEDRPAGGGGPARARRFPAQLRWPAIVVCAVVLLSGAWLGVSTRFDAVDVYNGSRFITETGLYQRFFPPVPNIPLQRFQAALAAGDPAEAARSAARVQNPLDYITAVYIPLTGLLEQAGVEERETALDATRRFLHAARGCDDTAACRRALRRGMQAAEWIAEKYNAPHLAGQVAALRQTLRGTTRE